MFGARDSNLCFTSIEPQLVSLGIVSDDVQGTLQATGAAGEQVGIVSDTDSSGAERSQFKSKLGVIERQETGIDVHFEVSTRSYMALPVPLVLLHPPTELVLELDVALCVLVGTFTVAEDVATLTNGEELPDLNVPLHRRESCLTIKGDSKKWKFTMD